MQVTVELPDELADVLHELEPCEDRALLVETVCGLYAQGRISGGKAARFLGLDRIVFQQALAKREIPLHYTMEELQHDVSFARGQ